ncbi:PREDICTED: mediator of RNA polymerase II transcription subunit 14-like, partial [Amphimedon queenslandica]|uniref:Mediator of RNA polymerase II transcription subunit 14 RM8 domain-containing protein n=3 Tax=Amphimedon queenslandica TaxID=400682 RepID=A0AAN0K4H4_AMPQE
MFVGSLSLLVHWVREAALDRYIVHQMSLVSVDRGVFSYKTDSLSLSLSLHPSTMSSLYLSPKPIQDNVWLPDELQILSDFFHSNVSLYDT